MCLLMLTLSHFKLYAKTNLYQKGIGKEQQHMECITKDDTPTGLFELCVLPTTGFFLL